MSKKDLKKLMKSWKKSLVECVLDFAAILGVLLKKPKMSKIKPTEYSREVGIRLVESYKQWVLVIGTGKSGVRLIWQK